MLCMDLDPPPCTSIHGLVVSIRWYLGCLKGKGIWGCWKSMMTSRNLLQKAVCRASRISPQPNVPQPYTALHLVSGLNPIYHSPTPLAGTPNLWQQSTSSSGEARLQHNSRDRTEQHPENRLKTSQQPQHAQGALRLGRHLTKH